MAKRKAKRRAPKELTRKQISRLERERRMEQALLWGLGVVVVLVVGVLAYGLIFENVIRTRQAVAIVDGVPITTAEFQARVKYTRMQMLSELNYLYQQQQLLDPNDADTQYYLQYIQSNIQELQNQLSDENALIIGEQAMDQLIQEALIRQEAQQRGITVSSQEIEEQIEQFFGYQRNPPTPTPTPTVTEPLTDTEPTPTPLPTPTPVTEEEFHRRYNNFLQQLKDLGVPERLYRTWVESSLLMDKVREQMRAELPTTDDQVKVRYITVNDEQRAQEMLSRLEAGEDFQALVDELRADEEVNGYGYELGWFPKDMLSSSLGETIAQQAFDMNVGERSQLIQGEDGNWYIIEVLGHEERPLEEYILNQRADEAFQSWLDTQQIKVERGSYRDRVPTEPSLSF